MCSLQTKVLPVVKIKTNPDRNIILTEVRKKVIFLHFREGTSWYPWFLHTAIFILLNIYAVEESNKDEDGRTEELYS